MPKLTKDDLERLLKEAFNVLMRIETSGEESVDKESLKDLTARIADALAGRFHKH